MIGNKISDKITSVSKKPAKELYKNDETEEDVGIAIPKKRYISPEDRQRIIDELRLAPKKNVYKSRYISLRKTTNYWLTEVSITI